MPEYGLIEIYDEEEGEWRLGYEGEWGIEEGSTTRPATPARLRLETLADFCDQNAESRNNGSYVGAHRILAAYLARQLGRRQATALLIGIAEFGGLDAMNGVGGEDSAFEEFGIADCWKDWRLPDDDLPAEEATA